MNPSGVRVNRRTAMTGVAGIAGGAALAGLTACSTSPSKGPQPTAGADLAAVSDVPATGGLVVTVDGAAVVLARDATGTVTAHSAICTHRGCTLRANQGELDCPCHGSVFDPITGFARRGPATVALPAIPVTTRGGRVVVDGGTSGA